MAIEFTMSGRPDGLKTEARQAADLQNAGLAAQQTATGTPGILDGDSLKVTSGLSTDLEKLVARLKNESDEVRQSVSQRRIAILQTVLSSMMDKVTETERKNILELEELNGQLDDAEKNLKDLIDQKSAAEARSVALDIEIKALENAVENEKKNGEAHRKLIEEKKKLKAIEDRKIQQLVNAIASSEQNIAGISSKIESCASAIGAATLQYVAEAVKAAAADVPAPEKTTSQAQEEKEMAKAEANNPLNIIRENLEKIDDEIMKTIEENRQIKA